MIKVAEPKAFSSRSNAKRAMLAFRDAYPGMEDVGLLIRSNETAEGYKFEVHASNYAPDQEDALTKAGFGLAGAQEESKPAEVGVDKAAKRAARKAEIESSKAEVTKIKADTKDAKAKLAAAKKASAKAAPKAKARVGGSKTEIVLKMLCSKKGATMAEVTDATGWRTMTFPGFAAKQGLTLTKSDDRPARYFGERASNPGA